MLKSEKSSDLLKVIRGVCNDEQWQLFLQRFDDNEVYSVLNMNLAKNLDPITLAQEAIGLAETAGSRDERVYAFSTDKIFFYARFESEQLLYTDLTEQFVTFRLLGPPHL